ncbi:protein commissureless 2 homolog [Homalodisca vitripennis]|uniref:protein commissureless 2 homolog n=1 Tax=Homalodisca vitripennis TaxID=197043 RepID=UPI001EEADBE7|nr:protein commissureless 2 homolog [Homalodisca vitripennis]
MTEVQDVALHMPPSVDPGGGAAVVVSVVEDEEYDRLLTDLWVGIVLTLMVLSCIGCLFSCFLYHAFRQWQARG